MNKTIKICTTLVKEFIILSIVDGQCLPQNKGPNKSPDRISNKKNTGNNNLPIVGFIKVLKFIFYVFYQEYLFVSMNYVHFQ